MFNNCIQIVIFLTLILLPTIKLCVFCQEITKYKSRKKYRIQKFQCIYKFTWSFLNILLPICILRENKLIFFIAIALVFLFRIVYLIINFNILPFFQKIGYPISCLIWLIYHSTFVLLAAIGQLSTVSWVNFRDIIKICGFIIIFVIVIGGFLDLLLILVKMLITIKQILK